MSRIAPQFKLGVQEDSHEFLRLLIDAMQKSCLEKKSYPFHLFRGTIESCIVCQQCKSITKKCDPIEDLGLEAVSCGGGLGDVNMAMEILTREETLEEYKCDSCNQVGYATKQTKLASIPPVLTLHLKRFRYGGLQSNYANSSMNGFVNRRANPNHHSTGSAKIEGHVRFEQIFDLLPFVTPQLKQSRRTMCCRLFAVIVHSGKNSHSGHYLAYVRNISKNEWWKMDDARICRVAPSEVMEAEA